MYEQAKREYMSLRQLKAQLRPHFRDMKESESIGGDVLAGYEKAYEGLLEFAKTKNRIVRRLAEIATTEGLEKATKKETRYEVIREMFPNPEDYIAFCQRGEETARSFFQQAQSALVTDGEAGQFMGKAFGDIGKLMERVPKDVQSIREDMLKKTIKEIYHLD